MSTDIILELPISIVKEKQDQLDWDEFFQYAVPSDKSYEIFIREFHNNFDSGVWDTISYDGSFSDNFLNEFQEYINWDIICYYNLSEDSIRKFKHKVNWDHVSQKALSEDFAREFQDQINWDILSEVYANLGKLSESFIIEFQEKLSWDVISCQKLSQKFIHEFKDKLDWKQVVKNNKLSTKFANEHAKYLLKAISTRRPAIK